MMSTDDIQLKATEQTFSNFETVALHTTDYVSLPLSICVPKNEFVINILFLFYPKYVHKRTISYQNYSDSVER